MSAGRDALLRWRGANLMDRRAAESDLRALALPVRLPTEEAITYALIDWLEDLEKRLAKRRKPKRRKAAKPKGNLPPELVAANARRAEIRAEVDAKPFLAELNATNDAA